MQAFISTQTKTNKIISENYQVKPAQQHSLLFGIIIIPLRYCCTSGVHHTFMFSVVVDKRDHSLRKYETSLLPAKLTYKCICLALQKETQVFLHIVRM